MVYAETSKIEDTWCGVLGYYDTEDDRTRDRHGPSKGQGQRRHLTQRSPNGNRYVLYFYFNDGAWNWNYNWLDNDWNVNNPSAVLANLFISLSIAQWQIRGSFVL